MPEQHMIISGAVYMRKQTIWSGRLKREPVQSSLSGVGNQYCLSAVWLNDTKKNKAGIDYLVSIWVMLIARLKRDTDLQANGVHLFK